MKKLYRSKNNKWLTGLCGGIAEYFDINPTVVRIAALLFEFSPLGLIAYFILAYNVPEQPEDTKAEDAKVQDDKTEDASEPDGK